MDRLFTAEPDPASWPALVSPLPTGTWHGKTAAQWRKLTRRELALPADRIIISTGHQAGFWHPGILAKYIAADALAEAIGRERVSAVHLVVDQDQNDCRWVDVPLRRDGDRLTVESVRLLGPTDAEGSIGAASQSSTSRPTGMLPARAPLPLDQNLDGALPSVRAGLDAMHVALQLHRASKNLAEQMARSTADLMSPWIAPMSLLFASDLLPTTFGRTIVAAMADDAASCAQHYNEAVRSHPLAGLRQLSIVGDEIELPVWRIDETGRRQRVALGDLRDRTFELASLRPRALLMTAIMRLAVCDLFIHGTGGLKYDRVMEQWVGGWLDLHPTPVTMATVDLRLPLREEDGRSISIDDAIGQYRRWWHDPPLAGADRSQAISPAKGEHLARINAALRKSLDRRAAFRGYHEWLERGRDDRADALDRAAAQISRARANAAEHAIAQRRTWAFPLYPAAMIDASAIEIRRSFAGRASGDASESGERRLPPDACAEA